MGQRASPAPCTSCCFRMNSPVEVRHTSTHIHTHTHTHTHTQINAHTRFSHYFITHGALHLDRSKTPPTCTQHLQSLTHRETLLPQPIYKHSTHTHTYTCRNTHTHTHTQISHTTHTHTLYTQYTLYTQHRQYAHTHTRYPQKT